MERSLINPTETKKSADGRHAVVFELHQDGRGVTAACYCAFHTDEPVYAQSRMFKTLRGARAYGDRYLGGLR